MNEHIHLCRDNAFELTLEWLGDVCKHVEAWKHANPSDKIREPLHSILNRIFESCKGAFTLIKNEQFEQVGTLLRVVIENLWLVDLFGSDHPKARQILEDWISGKKIKPYEVRKMLAEEFGDGIDEEEKYHRSFLDDVYSELCNYIHPQATPPQLSMLEPCVVVVLTSILGCLPSCLFTFQIDIPKEVNHKGHVLMAEVPFLLSANQPDLLKIIAKDFEISIKQVIDEQDIDK